MSQTPGAVSSALWGGLDLSADWYKTMRDFRANPEQENYINHYMQLAAYVAGCS
jgi:hypothetical protein